MICQCCHRPVEPAPHVCRPPDPPLPPLMERVADLEARVAELERALEQAERAWL